MKERIAEILKQEIGLDIETIGVSALDAALRTRLAQNGIEDVCAYLALLEASPVELQELIETIVVPETWFFRDMESFNALGKLALALMNSPRPPKPLRVLSIPSSTGEEPYTIAMTLLDAGIASNDFAVDAVDISQRSLALAERAIYGRNAFRGQELRFRDRYFEPVKQGYQLLEAARRQVRFRHGNLLSPSFLDSLAQYSIIFCRNLLIYFDLETQQRVVASLDRLLQPEGYFFVGPSETFLWSRCGFVAVNEARSFVFRKARATPAPSESRPAAKHSARAPATKPQPLIWPARRLAQSQKSAIPALAIPHQKPAVAAPAVGRTTLDDAQALANTGRLEAAHEACMAHIAAQGTSADACNLLGLIHDAQGKANLAEEQYRKALYLKPDHVDALQHLALLAERKGDHASAGRFQERARRAAGGNGS